MGIPIQLNHILVQLSYYIAELLTNPTIAGGTLEALALQTIELQLRK